MKRVMIVGQPGAGKSTLARALGERTGLPVYHIDKIHWKPGWNERPRDEKTQMCSDIHAKDQWIFEGGHSVTWKERLARCDTLIWIDLEMWRRMFRVTRRSLRDWGKVRPDMQADCPEQFSLEFYQFIWRTNKSARAKLSHLFNTAPRDKTRIYLGSDEDTRSFLSQCCLRSPKRAGASPAHLPR